MKKIFSWALLALLLVAMPSAARPPEAYYKIEMLKPVPSKSAAFIDKNIKVHFTAGMMLHFVLENRTNDPIVIHWNKASLMGADKKTLRIANQDVRLSTVGQPIAETFLPPGAILEDGMIPVQNIGREVVPAFPRTRARSLKGTDFYAYLPMTIGNKLENYFFQFRIIDRAN